ncbi:uncharacterized protein LOC135494351 [Lineus longissimus]|uniref:uncharacterized protein LOC135494351 n=1 Tax=Lineus longissimus TaxID=88925 RepID=UPI00315D1BDD
MDEFPGLSDIILTNTKEVSAVQQLNTLYKQNRYYKERFSLVEPTEIVLSRNAQNKPVDTFQYIPLPDQLSALMKHEDVDGHVIVGHKSDASRIEDYCDGSLYEMNEIFQENCHHLQIFGYVDEFTVSNPLRNKAKKYKITAVYYILGNIPPKLRSRLYVIQVACLARSIHVKKYGLEAILAPFLRDLKQLESEGIHLTSSGLNVQVKGALCLVCGDNLGCHQIGGFSENFSSGLICRFCMATRDDIQVIHDVQEFTQRTIDSYNDQIEMVTEDPRLSSTYGVKKDSPLNALKHYHVAEGLPPDLAHDIFEGVACELIVLVVNYSCKKGFFSLKSLNKAIRNLDYGEPDKSTKHSEMSEEISKFAVKQTACQTWCLLRLFGILVGEGVPHDDDVWGLLLDLQELVDIM